MTTTEIIGAIMMSTGLKPGLFADINGFQKQTFYRVVRGDQRSNAPVTKKIRAAISEATGLEIDELWPDDKQSC